MLLGVEKLEVGEEGRDQFTGGFYRDGVPEDSGVPIWVLCSEQISTLTPFGDVHCINFLYH